MAVLNLILMGGNGLFYNAFGETLDSGLVHEILGAVLFVLWVIHIVWNSAWIKGFLKGKYNALRITCSSRSISGCISRCLSVEKSPRA